MLQKATKDAYREQFSASRLADAIGVLEHRWDHFNDKAMPHELAACMREDRTLGDSAVESAKSVEVQFQANSLADHFGV